MSVLYDIGVVAILTGVVVPLSNGATHFRFLYGKRREILNSYFAAKRNKQKPTKEMIYEHGHFCDIIAGVILILFGLLMTSVNLIL